MKSLFETTAREEVVARLGALQPASVRHWGKMDSGQMLCHCARALETATGDRPMKQKFIGKLLMPFLRKSILGEKPFGKNSPTDPTFVVSETCDFEAERARVLGLINRFVERGETAAGNEIHGFFGRLSGQEWGEVMYKHLDHHLRQFGV